MISQKKEKKIADGAANYNFIFTGYSQIVLNLFLLR